MMHKAYSLNDLHGTDDLVKMLKYQEFVIKWLIEVDENEDSDNQKTDSICNLMPVFIPYSKRIYFLNLQSRSLLHTSNKIDCNNRPEGTFIVEEDNRAFMIGPKGRKVSATLSMMLHKKPFNANGLDFWRFDSTLFEAKPPRLHQYSILQLILTFLLGDP